MIITVLLLVRRDDRALAVAEAASRVAIVASS